MQINWTIRLKIAIDIAQGNYARTIVLFIGDFGLSFFLTICIHTRNQFFAQCNTASDPSRLEVPQYPHRNDPNCAEDHCQSG